jgi:hypothetical protein
VSGRRLILGFVALSALHPLYPLLPGNPYYPDAESAIFWAVVHGLLLWFLWRGSAAAWTVLVVMHGLTLVAIVLFSAGGPAEPDLAGMFIFEFVLVGLLLARPLRRHVWGPRLPASTAPGH